MKNNFSTILAGLLFGCVLMMSPVIQAEEIDNQLPEEERSYADKVGDKALTGFVNMTTAPLEIPKSIITISNESNLAFGFIGGTLKGILNTAGRFASGTSDLFTAVVPTKPAIYPEYVWDDFDTDTVYGKNFRLDNEASLPKD
jgi:putative exosortase-associated protein (TIGR04073 family)